MSGFLVDISFSPFLTLHTPGIIIDRSHKYIVPILLYLIGATGCALAFPLIIPNAGASASFGSVCALSAFTGFFGMALMPGGVELATEAMFPLPVGTVTGVLAASGGLISFVLDKIQSAFINGTSLSPLALLSLVCPTFTK